MIMICPGLYTYIHPFNARSLRFQTDSSEPVAVKTYAVRNRPVDGAGRGHFDSHAQVVQHELRVSRFDALRDRPGPSR